MSSNKGEINAKQGKIRTKSKQRYVGREGDILLFGRGGGGVSFSGKNN